MKILQREASQGPPYSSSVKNSLALIAFSIGKKLQKMWKQKQSVVVSLPFVFMTVIYLFQNYISSVKWKWYSLMAGERLRLVFPASKFSLSSLTLRRQLNGILETCQHWNVRLQHSSLDSSAPSILRSPSSPTTLFAEFNCFIKIYFVFEFVIKIVAINW